MIVLEAVRLAKLSEMVFGQMTLKKMKLDGIVFNIANKCIIPLLDQQKYKDRVWNFNGNIFYDSN